MPCLRYFSFNVEYYATNDFFTKKRGRAYVKVKYFSSSGCQIWSIASVNLIFFFEKGVVYRPLSICPPILLPSLNTAGCLNCYKVVLKTKQNLKNTSKQTNKKSHTHTHTHKKNKNKKTNLYSPPCICNIYCNY
jgi:hypothetical protein